MQDVIDSSMNADTGIPLEAKNLLNESARWGKILAIVGFVSIGLLVIVALFMGAYLGSMPEDLTGLGSGGVAMISVIYIVFAIIYFFPALYLYRFSSHTLSGVKNNSDELIIDGLRNLKSMMKYVGILTLIIIGLYVIGILLMILFVGSFPI